jgi:MFS family permease
MQQELGWSRTALTGAYSLAIIVSGVAAIPVGRWLDRHGARALMTTGAAAASLLVLAWAQVTDLAAFYATWIGIGVAMAAVLYEPAFAVIATWFRDAAERTRALLGLTVIAGFASVIYVPMAGWLVQTLGWRQALVVLAALLVVLTVLPNAILPGRRPDELDRPPHGQGTIPVAGAEPVPGSRCGGRWGTRPCGGWPRRWSPPPWPPPPSPSTCSPTCANSTTRPALRRPGPGCWARGRWAGASWSRRLAGAGRWRPPRPSSSPSKLSPSCSCWAWRDRPGWSPS